MILDDLAEAAKKRSAKAQKEISLEEMKQKALSMEKGDFPFEKALKKEDLSFICELKKASPSKGVIAPDFRPFEIAREYEQAGADALSILTEPFWFLGSDDILAQVAKETSLPILRKDFTIDEYMIYQAKVLGADAVLLIVAILNDQQLKDYVRLADELGLSALVEAHDEKEIQRAIAAGARIIGVNNRNLKDFSMNFDNARSLRSSIPDGVLFVSESGIKNAQDVKGCRQMRADAVLIGETLMRAADKKAMLQELKNDSL